MLNLLLNQQVTTKIPGGVSAAVEIANKTGETDTENICYFFAIDNGNIMLVWRFWL